MSTFPVAFFLSFELPSLFLFFPPFAGVWIWAFDIVGFGVVFTPPHYKSRLQVFSMQLFWSRVPPPYDGSHLLASFVSRVERLLSAFSEFFTERLLVVLTHFYFFCPPFCFLSTFAVAMLWFAFCGVVRCRRVLWFWCLGGSHQPDICFYFVFSFHYQKESFFFNQKTQWRFNVILFLQLITQVCCFFLFYVFPRSFFIMLLLVTLSSIFGWFPFLLDDAGCTRGVLILSGVRCVFCFPCGRGWTDIFLPAGIYNTSWQVAVCVQ